MHCKRILPAYIFLNSLPIDKGILPNQSIFASPDPIGTEDPPLGEQTDGNILQKHELPDNSIASSEFPSSSWPPPLLELPHNNRIGILEWLNIGNPGVGHVALNGGTVPALPCASSSADGLVISEFISAEYEIVHGALAAGYMVEGF